MPSPPLIFLIVGALAFAQPEIVQNRQATVGGFNMAIITTQISPNTGVGNPVRWGLLALDHLPAGIYGHRHLVP